MIGGIYVHVPWCRAICPYCAFAVVRDMGQVPWAAYVDRVLWEREHRREDLPEPPATLYLGGGTPSRMPPNELQRLIRGLQPVEGAEITAELNPEDATDIWLDAAREAGVTRISVGVQTLSTTHARLLGRGHTSPQAIQAIQRITCAGIPSWSADLMFALPGQTLEDLTADLDALLDLDPPHVSLYGLTFEAGTPFEARRRAGKLQPTEDDVWRAMYDTIVDRLQRAGLDRYEVSNFARPGHESVHNQGYWEGRPYLGLGPGAHGFGVGGHRWVNHADPAIWLASDDPTVHREWPIGEDAAIDRLLTGLRTPAGVRVRDLILATGHRPSDAAIQRLTDGGMLVADDTRLRLTHDAFPIADAVIGALVTDLVREPG